MFQAPSGSGLSVVAIDRRQRRAPARDAPAIQRGHQARVCRVRVESGPRRGLPSSLAWGCFTPGPGGPVRWRFGPCAASRPSGWLRDSAVHGLGLPVCIKRLRALSTRRTSRDRTAASAEPNPARECRSEAAADWITPPHRQGPHGASARPQLSTHPPTHRGPGTHRIAHPPPSFPPFESKATSIMCWFLPLRIGRDLISRSLVPSHKPPRDSDGFISQPSGKQSIIRPASAKCGVSKHKNKT
jgi:hypothetical protein